MKPVVDVTNKLLNNSISATHSVTPSYIPVQTSSPTIQKTESVYNIAIINATTSIRDDQLAEVIAALQIQIDRDFTPIWKVGANLIQINKNQTAPANMWWLVIMENLDIQSTSGYYDLTSTGLPLGKVFLKPGAQFGNNWSITVSHELLEMIVDPYINLTVFEQTSNTVGRLYAYEICDAVESDIFGYRINNILVSNFVTPAWFEGWRSPNSVQFDYKRVLNRPYQLQTGGYIGVFDVYKGGGWHQILSHGETKPSFAEVSGTRKQRRSVNKNEWKLSE